MKRINEEQKKTIKEMLEHRYDYRSIAEKVGVCEATVARYKKLLNEECGIEASNRWNGGIVSSGIIPKNFKEEVREESQRNDITKFVVDVEQTTTMKGALTTFVYGYSTKTEILSVETYNSNNFELCINDIVGFANELLDIAVQIEKLRK